MKTVIFTDLDGTFLNHDDYSFADAKESLELLKSKKIPIVFTTSKTRVEVEKLQEKVEINEPFIIENGAAIFFPKNYQNFNLSFLDELDNYYLYQLGLSYNKILEFYNKYKKEFGMFGFSDMSVEEVINYTGLDRQSAILSKKRDFTEPFLIKDDFSIEKLQNLASNYDIKITKGGRFYHLIGKYQDKGLAVKKAIEIFENLYNVKIDSIGLGDGPNDIAMFENVKKAVIIKNHKNDYVEYFGNNQQKSSYQGSKGWNEMVLKNV
ncbi:HAD-IIB family hydrolase [Halarcobacter sp.]|uniref:HAD-IIB family hydrolase n=1 Tax=Halarcobacter sp. TaxID=2321133 RepID=UPI002AA8D228|nr:HAD-IIB family hydrolase [Halarcobacter sp.]